MKATIEFEQYEIIDMIRDRMQRDGLVPNGKTVLIKFHAAGGLIRAVADITDPSPSSYFDR